MTRSGWFGRLAAVAIAAPAHRLGVTRRQLCALRLVLGLLAAAMLAAGPVFFAPAAGVFLGGFLFAHAEAQLAKRQHETDAATDRRAFAGDVASNALAFLGLGVGLESSGASFRLSDGGSRRP